MGTLVISDIHIGDNSPTCWYQRSVHEDYLCALLDWLIENVTAKNPSIDRLIILGDLFDFWTYPPDKRPPTTQDILDANPKLFGADGKMRKVMDALGGNVLYVRGNHDINITQADLDLIPTGRNKIKLMDDIYYDSDRIVYTHGHLFTMFNAADPRFPGEVPVGHFVTRAIAYHVNKHLNADQPTAAHWADQGSPYGPDLSSIIPGLLGQFNNPSITSCLLDYIAEWADLPEDYTIMMADGTRTSIAKAKAKYDYLWTSWVTRNGGGEFGEAVAAKAAFADFDGTYMAWFAQRVAMQRGALGTVMGHTHNPKLGIRNSIIQYINSGFECPSVPDIDDPTEPKHFNFATVDSQSNLHLWEVVKNGEDCEVKSVRADPDQVVFGPCMDYSCYVRITNNTNNELVMQAYEARYGDYVVPPPNLIPPNTTVDIWLQDLPGIHGAEGSITYSHPDGSERLTFSYGCPTGPFSNYALGGAELVAASGNPPSSISPHNQVPDKGHPLFVHFFVATGVSDISLRQFLISIGADPAAGIRHLAPDAPFISVRDLIRTLSSHPLPWIPTSPLALAVDAAGFLYDPGQDIIYSRMNPLQRQAGYAYGYDAAAIAINGILDCEPIFFDYAGKHWMIELWKGQYGLETGCEIGVYNRQIGSSSPLYTLLDSTIGCRACDPFPSHNLFFDCANDDELMIMSATLYKNGQKLFSRGPEKHWWLTGFKWGVNSRPDELTMDVSITCLDMEMCGVLSVALQSMGYKIRVSSNTIRFTFVTPTSHQPRSDIPTLVPVVEAANQRIVNEYNAFGFPNNDPNLIFDEAIDIIMNAVGSFNLEFFAQTVLNLAKSMGLDVYNVINELAQAFEIEFSDWVGSVEDALGINLDFSCIVEISNRGNPYDLILESNKIDFGNYEIQPPARIPAGRLRRFWLKDPKLSPVGSGGWVQYSYVDSANNKHYVTFTYACPCASWEANVASTSAPFNFYTKSDNVTSAWSGINQIITGGHPLFVAFVYGNTSPSS